MRRQADVYRMKFLDFNRIDTFRAQIINILLIGMADCVVLDKLRSHLPNLAYSAKNLSLALFLLLKIKIILKP